MYKKLLTCAAIVGERRYQRADPLTSPQELAQAGGGACGARVDAAEVDLTCDPDDDRGVPCGGLEVIALSDDDDACPAPAPPPAPARACARPVR